VTNGNGGDPRRRRNGPAAAADDASGTIEARAMRDAAAAFERFIDDVDGPSAPRPRIDGAIDRLERAGLDAGGDGFVELRGTVMRTTQLYLELLQRTADDYLSAVEGLVRRGAATLSGGDTGSALALTALPGGRAVAPLWIHNTTDASVSGVTLRLTDLTAADGARIAATSAAFSPAALDVSAAETRRASLSVAVPRSIASGTYHGHVLVAGLQGASIPVRLAVPPAAADAADVEAR
jgi:hypothetical protein